MACVLAITKLKVEHLEIKTNHPLKMLEIGGRFSNIFFQME